MNVRLIPPVRSPVIGVRHNADDRAEPLVLMKALRMPSDCVRPREHVGDSVDVNPALITKVSFTLSPANGNEAANDRSGQKSFGAIVIVIVARRIIETRSLGPIIGDPEPFLHMVAAFGEVVACVRVDNELSVRIEADG
jgi:hypothetical protein